MSALISALAFIAAGFGAGWLVRNLKAEADLSRGITTGPRESVTRSNYRQDIPAIWR
jgi:hypothetical protein